HPDGMAGHGPLDPLAATRGDGEVYDWLSGIVVKNTRGTALIAKIYTNSGNEFRMTERTEWSNDPAKCRVRQVNRSPFPAAQAHRLLVLFDGDRSHQVAPAAPV